MELSEYQARAVKTVKPGIPLLPMAAMGLAGESGEVIEQVKKHLFHGHALNRQKLAEEMGDCLWYLAALADSVGIDLSWIAANNLSKLNIRYGQAYSDAASIERKDCK